VNNKTTIAVTGPNKRMKYGWWATRLILAICRLRGVYITAGKPGPVSGIHGVIIGGGDDVEPKHYGQSGDAGRVYDPERDAFEMAVIKQCLEQNVPLLGICRGAQLINIVHGGSLYPDIRPLRKTTPNYNTALPVKWVKVSSGSLLSQRAGTNNIKVNSLHSQAIHELGDNLQTTAKDSDGFIQAIESASGMVMGVQWHPEYMPYSRPNRKLISAFGNVARASYGVTLHLLDAHPHAKAKSVS
jgi:putative glutamine amidotransferase